MLVHLEVSNIGVLKDAEIEPDAGFTVITGETGTGKTLLLGALRLLMGQKPPTSVVGPFSGEARAQGVFEILGEEIGVTRIVPKVGRSRAYRDGYVVSAPNLEDLTSEWVEIAAQHDHVRLRRPSTVLEMVDDLVRQTTPGLLTSFAEAWESHRRLLTERDELGGDGPALERELDLALYQLAEIEGAGLDDHDEASVEALSSRLRNQDAIREGIASTLDRLDQLATPAGEVVSALRRLAGFDPALAALSEQADAIDIEIGSLRRGVDGFWEAVGDGKEDLAAVEAWLNQVGDLRRKYGRTIEDVRDFGSRLEVRVGEIRAAIGRSVTIDRDMEESTARLGRIAEELSGERHQAGERLVTEAIGHLADLGLGDAVLRLDWSTLDEPGPNGADAVTLLFASDDRLEPGAIGEVASGGELSRLILALRLAGRDESSSTLVFDEVDAGIGGSTALALGEKIASLAETSQVIAVTHLPQVAAHASRHYVVDRSGDTAVVHLVEGDERVTELTRMLSGLPGSEGGRDAVSELLAVVGAEAHPG